MLRRNPPPPPANPDLLDGLLAPAGTPLAGQLWPQVNVTYRGLSGRFDTVVGNGFVLMSIERPDDVLCKDRLARLAAIGCRIIALQDPEFEDDEGIYQAHFQGNGLALLLARPDFSLFGTARATDAAADLVDQLFAGLDGKPRVVAGLCGKAV